MDQVELDAGDRQGLRRSSNLVKKRGKILLGALLEETRMGALSKSPLHNGRYFALGFLALLWAVAARELWPIKAAVEAVPDASEGGAPVILALGIVRALVFYGPIILVFSFWTKARQRRELADTPESVASSTKGVSMNQNTGQPDRFTRKREDLSPTQDPSPNIAPERSLSARYRFEILAGVSALVVLVGVGSYLTLPEYDPPPVSDRPSQETPQQNRDIRETSQVFGNPISDSDSGDLPLVNIDGLYTAAFPDTPVFLGELKFSNGSAKSYMLNDAANSLVYAASHEVNKPQVFGEDDIAAAIRTSVTLYVQGLNGSLLDFQFVTVAGHPGAYHVVEFVSNGLAFTKYTAAMYVDGRLLTWGVADIKGLSVVSAETVFKRNVGGFKPIR